RKKLLRRWPAIFVPMLHGAVFLTPIPLASVITNDHGIVSLSSGWAAGFGLEGMLYIVGTGFMGMVLANERAGGVHKNAASTDALTGLHNRRGFLEGAQALIARGAEKREPVSVLIFDLDHFKTVNDRYGHAVGDEALRIFGLTVNRTLRASDLL